MVTDMDTLEHYGTKGMKWGVRKDSKIGRTGKAAKNVTKLAVKKSPDAARRTEALVEKYNIGYKLAKRNAKQLQKGAKFAEKVIAVNQAGPRKMAEMNRAGIDRGLRLADKVAKTATHYPRKKIQKKLGTNKTK